MNEKYKYSLTILWNNDKNNITRVTNKGNIINNYIPFKNLIKPNDTNPFSDFNTNKLKWDLNHPVDIKIQDLLDGSVNLILNDDINKPLMINSRFSTLEDNTYIIPDHKGDKDTSIYEEDNLELDASLYKSITKIPKIQFIGLDLNGFFKCGSYHFYFKLCDNDDNETDFIAESGLVTCHIGNINNPKSIRMGLQDENSEKSIKFKLSNLDGSYDFLKVYYSRTSSGEAAADVTTYYKFLDKFPILAGSIDLLLFGNEPSTEISIEEINEKFQYCEHVKTLEICQNRLFLGNIQKPIIDYDTLELFALNIIPSITTEESIGSLTSTYNETASKNPYGYYNALNIYYRLGYWPDEYYRFGIVFILNDFTLSNVFNIRGINLLNKNNGYTSFIKDKNLCKITWSEDGYLISPDNIIIKDENALGITVLNKPENFNLDNPIGVSFKLSDDYIDKPEQFDNIKKIIKGFFFVRQKRKPTILAQGCAIGKTTKNFGNLPCIQDKNGYFSESFLTPDSNNSMILSPSKVKIENKNVEVKAAIVPDAIIREPLFNLIFLGLKFKYERVLTNSDINNNNYNYFFNKINPGETLINSCQFLNIPTGIKLITNNTDYFSSLAGIAQDVKDFVSVLHDWKHEGSSNITVGHSAPNSFMRTKLIDSIPFQLKRDQIIRGMFGAYVGLSENKLNYGDIFNIRTSDYNPNSLEYLNNLIKIRKYDYSPYFAISDRLNIDELGYKIIKIIDEGKQTEKKVYQNVTCYRGDCYICNFTHRIIRNHVDPELPTNNKIVDLQGWDDNFLVLTKTKFQDSESPTGYTYVNEVIPLFKGKNLYDPQTGKSIAGDKAGMFFASLFTLGLATSSASKINYDLDLSDLNWNQDSVSIILPNDSKYSKIGSAGEMFGFPNTWYEYGTDKINRSDVNSVPIGHWITIKVMSNYNLCMRDIDQYHTDEKVIFNHARGFYPYYPASTEAEYKLPESKLINGAANLTLSSKYNFTLPDSPYIKQQYDTRILYSDVYNGGFKNGFRVFRQTHYLDFPKTYGALVKLVELSGDLIAVMEHGIMRIPVNERALSGAGSGGNVFINTDNVLPKNPLIVSDVHGSIWADSVLKTDGRIYGVDTFTKKIWVTDGSAQCVLLSDFKLQKFLNDNINLSEWDKQCEIGFKNVKTHYNKFKKDIMFTFYNDDKIWNLCYNEYSSKFISFYSWTPSMSENINNVFISFDLNDTKNILDKYYGFEKTNFYKHFINRMQLKLYKNEDNKYADQSFGANLTGETNGLILDFNEVPNDIYKNDSEVKHPYPRLYDELSHEDNKYVTLDFLEDQNSLQLHFKDEYKVGGAKYNELLKRKYLNLKFKCFYYDTYKEKDPEVNSDLNILKEKKSELVPDLTTLKQKDLYLRLYNPNKCTNELWKHGQGGIFDGQGNIEPTKWYDQLEKLEFEFVVALQIAQLKIFYTLQLLSNKTKPEEFEFEVVGESYEWYKYKDIINWANKMSANEEELKRMYFEILSSTQKELYDKYLSYPKLDSVQDNYIIKQLPFIRHIRKDVLGQEHYDFEKNTTEVELINDELLSENRIRQSQICNDIKNFGRISGNSEYVEDNWFVEIRPMNFKNAYINKEGILSFKKINQNRIRDKYIKIKVRYSGKDMVVIQGIKTLFDYSYA